MNESFLSQHPDAVRSRQTQRRKRMQRWRDDGQRRDFGWADNNDFAMLLEDDPVLAVSAHDSDVVEHLRRMVDK